jgi:hypothetical protein
MSWWKNDENDDDEEGEDEETDFKAGEDRIVFLIDAR